MTIVNISTVRETIENIVAEFNGGLSGWSTGAEDFNIDELLEEFDRIDTDRNEDEELGLPESEVENGEWLDTDTLEEAFGELLISDWPIETLSGAIFDAVNWAVREQFTLDCYELRESIVEALEELR